MPKQKAKAVGDDLDKFKDQITKLGKLSELKLYKDILDRIKAGKRLSASELKEFKRLRGLFEGSGAERVDRSYVITNAGISKRALNYQEKAKHIRFDKDGLVDKKAADDFINAHSSEKKGSSGFDLSQIVYDKEVADKRYREARAIEKELQVAIMQGEIIKVSEVEKMFTDRAYEFCRRLKILSRRVGQDVAGKCEKTFKEVTDIIDQEVYSMMIEYSRPMTINQGN